MEARLAAHPLFADYERLVGRFATDLSERDALLARSAVLMLLQEAASRASDS
jgi:hypothetical protein